MTRVDIKTAQASVSQSLSIDDAILGSIQKRLLFVMIDNKDFLDSLVTNPFKFHHFNMDSFSHYINGKYIPSTDLHLNIKNEKLSVMVYRTLFQGTGFRHSNAGLQISHAMFVNGYFVLLFYLTPDHGASEVHTSHSDSGNIRIELKFRKALPVPTTCLLYSEYDSFFRIDSSRNVTTDF